MRKALLIGIDYYESGNCLKGCVNDALSMQEALRFNHDGSRNFETQILLATDKDHSINHEVLARLIDWLFEGAPEIALFYFSGHGSFSGEEGYLCPSNAQDLDTCVPMTNLIGAAMNSKAQNKMIVLDCCHSGAAGIAFFSNQLSVLPEDTVIMAGCSKDGYSVESNGSGVYTQLFVEALNGAGSNLMGEVSPGSVYAYVDKSLGAFEQRPVFKANVKSFICLKKNEAPIEIKKLRLLDKLFADPDLEFPLDPSYEEDKNNLPEGASAERNEAHEEVFKILRDYYQVGLVVPIKEKYMYWAAVHSTGCKLTALGKHYWHLIHKGII